MPANARTDESGSRFYEWAPEGQDPVSVLSVTTVRKLCGAPPNLVNWMIANIINSASGTYQVERIGPRGGIKKGYEADGPFPGEFVKRLLATEGADKQLEDVRRWLRESAERPRDIAAMRGTIVHEAIERDDLEPDTERVRYLFEQEGRERGRKTALTVTDDDVLFVQHTLRQYRHFADTEPGAILLAERQCWNLTLGYAGSFDALREVEFEGEMVRAVIDYKTASDTYTDNVAQVHGYLLAEFIGNDGVIDEQATELLSSATHGGILHLRPDGWSLHLFPVMPEVAQAFVGSVMLARLLADHEQPHRLFAETRSGKAEI